MTQFKALRNIWRATLRQSLGNLKIFHFSTKDRLKVTVTSCIKAMMLFLDPSIRTFIQKPISKKLVTKDIAEYCWMAVGAHPMKRTF